MEFVRALGIHATKHTNQSLACSLVILVDSDSFSPLSIRYI
jgi:hypothetical protein